MTIELAPGVSVFVADNGSGKTNVLEGVFYLSQLASHRLGGHEVLVRNGAKTAQIVARVSEKDRNETYEVQLPMLGRRALFINKNLVTQARKFRNRLRAVLFAPEDLKIIRDDPAVRRDELDQLIAAYSPMNSLARTAFDKALKQRNSLLKTLQKSQLQHQNSLLDSLADWDKKFIDYASDLVVARQNTIEALGPKLKDIYSELTDGQDVLTIRYVAKSVDYSSLANTETIKNELQAALLAMRSIELVRGVTMVGPHRDDIEIEINNHMARTQASQGEAWSIALAWRVATFDLLTDRHESPPVLLLDDVFTQLDNKRRELLISRFAKADQVLITTAVASDVPDRLWNHRFEIKEGEVIAVT